MQLRVSPRLYLAITLFLLSAREHGRAQTPVKHDQTRARPGAEHGSTLRVSEPVEAITDDLRHYIPERMLEDGVPGLAISLIHDSRVVWSEGFGVASTITHRRVTPETVFEVASNSKGIAAYAALRFADQGKLSLDDPLVGYLTEPWLPSSKYGDQITLRHVASHSSGLGDDPLFVEKRIALAPGTEFLYSSTGALYIQEAIEQITDTWLEDSAPQLVFEPLRMSSSSFINRPDLLPHMASGHTGNSAPLLAFVLSFAIIVTGIPIIGMPILRLSTGRWWPRRAIVKTACIGAAVLDLLVLVLLAGRSLPNLICLVALCAVGFVLALTALHRTGQWTITHLPAALRRRSLRRVLQIAWTAVSVITLLWLAGMATGPLPKGPSPQPSAIGSVHTSAPDLAAFLIELARPRHLSAELGQQIRTPQVSAGKEMSWGLGPGIVHARTVTRFGRMARLSVSGV